MIGFPGFIKRNHIPHFVTDAPLISTFVALALIPVAFLFTHAYFSGKKHMRFHSVTGSAAVVWDLALSVFYMMYRTFGGEVEGSTLDISGALLVYFIAHGLIAIVVIVLEVVVLTTAILQIKKKREYRLHTKLAPYLFIVWFAAFLSGEIVYLVNYVL